MRRSIAFLILLMTIAFQTEPVFGEARDGSVHHENVAEAFVHAHDSRGSHSGTVGEEAGGVPTGPEVGSPEEHEHGGSSDHCTHLHGMALVSPIDVGFVFRESSCQLALAALPTNARYETLIPPPRS